MPLLYLVRHGENPANVERVMSHKVVDHPLNERGARQAAALGRWFLDRALGCIYTSPLRRAYETAEQIAAATGAPIVVREELRELNVGDLDGKGDLDAWVLHDAVMERWRAGDWPVRFPGGESYRELVDRLDRVLREVVALHPEQDAALVAHGGIFSAALPRLCQIPGHDGTAPLRLGNTAITVLRHAPGELACERWGVVDHLPPDLRELGGAPRPT